MAQPQPLWELTAVPVEWPLQTVLDAWAVVAGTRSRDDAVQRGLRVAEKALNSRLQVLWASQPQDAQRWFAQHWELYFQQNLDGWMEEEQLREVLWQHSFRSSRDKSHFSAAGLVAAPWPAGVDGGWRGSYLPSALARRLLAAQGPVEAEAEAKRRRLEAASSTEELQAKAEERLRTELVEAREQREALAAQLAEAEAVELRAAQEECGRLTDGLAVAVSELQAARDELLKCHEGSATNQTELQQMRVENSELRERCQQLEMRMAASEEASANPPDLQNILVENAVYRDRCEQLQQNLVKVEMEATTTMAEIRKLCEEKGMYKERCAQLQRQLESQQRNTQDAAARFLDPTVEAHGHRPGLPEEASGSQDPESNANEEMADDDGAQDRCFLADALFTRRDEKGREYFVPGKDLEIGNLVVAEDSKSGKTLVKVLSVQVTCEDTQVIHLQAGAATLQVTPGHRVRVPGMNGELDRDLALKAVSLKKGDKIVLDDGKPVELTSAEPCDARLEVLEIVFSPDLPVATFSRPPCILSLGQKASAQRRGRLCHGGQGTCDQTADLVSIPPTAPGEYGD